MVPREGLFFKENPYGFCERTSRRAKTRQKCSHPHAEDFWRGNFLKYPSWVVVPRERLFFKDNRYGFCQRTSRSAKNSPEMFAFPS